MGQIDSASTIYAVAYLTNYARGLLFNNTNRYVSDGNATYDKFQITHFSLHDNDENYAIAGNLSTGEVPDASGKKDTCIKAVRLETKEMEGGQGYGGIYVNGEDAPVPLTESYQIRTIGEFTMNINDKTVSTIPLP